MTVQVSSADGRESRAARTDESPVRVHERGKDLLNVSVAIEVLDERGNAANAALRTASDGGTNGVTLSALVRLQELQAGANEVEDGNDEGAEGDRAH